MKRHIIGPSGTDYTVTSSDPDAVAVEQMLTCWVAVAKAEGSVEIIASNSAGQRCPDERRLDLLQPALHLASRSGGGSGRSVL